MACVCVLWGLLVCLSVFSSMTDVRGGLCTLLPLCVVFAEWHVDLLLYPTLTGPCSLGWCPKILHGAFVFIEHEVNTIILAFHATSGAFSAFFQLLIRIPLGIKTVLTCGLIVQLLLHMMQTPFFSNQTSDF